MTPRKDFVLLHRRRILYYGTDEGFCTMAPMKDFVLWHRGRILYYGTDEGFCTMAPRKDLSYDSGGRMEAVFGHAHLLVNATEIQSTQLHAAPL